MRCRARQRGAIGLFGVLTLLLALLFTALAVDAGRLWYERRHLQAIADIAALEAAKNLGCGSAAGNVTAAAQAAAARNGFASDLGAAPNIVEVGGLGTAATGLRRFTAGAASDAVHVIATESVPASLVLGGFFGKQALISAEATARAEPSHATFDAGSYLLRISTSSQDASLLNGLLGGLLGSSLSLDALSYKGLASADVNLADLVRADGTVGSVDELLSANTDVAHVIGLAATAAGQDSAVAASLNQLKLAAVNNAAVRLGDVLDVSVPASDAAGKVGINVFDLVATTILVANKQHAVSIPNLSINLGGLINVNAAVAIGEPPQIAVGPPGRNAAGQWCAQAKTAQVTANATVHSNITVLGTGLVLDLGLAATVAQGEAHLETLDTVPGATQAVIGATPGIAALNLTGSSGAGPATASLVVLGFPIGITIGLNLPIQPASATDLVYNVPTPTAGHLPMEQGIASPLGASLATALNNPNAITLGVQIGNLGLLTGAVTAIVNTLLSPLKSLVANLLSYIGSALLDPLLKLLGIQLGGLDVTVEDIKYTGGSRLVI